jgi:hypothetical protein
MEKLSCEHLKLYLNLRVVHAGFQSATVGVRLRDSPLLEHGL